PPCIRPGETPLQLPPPPPELLHAAMGGGAAMPGAVPVAAANAATAPPRFAAGGEVAGQTPPGFLRWLSGAMPPETNAFGRWLLTAFRRNPEAAPALWGQ